MISQNRKNVEAAIMRASVRVAEVSLCTAAKRGDHIESAVETEVHCAPRAAKLLQEKNSPIGCHDTRKAVFSPSSTAFLRQDGKAKKACSSESFAVNQRLADYVFFALQFRY
jgi:hypothetical protein